MKKTTCLLLATFLLLLLSCSTESNNQPQGKRIGTWMAYPNKAYWKGSDQTPQMASRAFMAKTESDSIAYLEAPKHVSLTMENHKEDKMILVTFVDSTLPFKTDGLINTFNLKLQYPLHTAYSTSVALHAEYFTGLTPIGYIKCDSIYTDSQNLIFTYDVGDSTKSVELNTSGLFSTMKYLQGCH